MEDRYEIIGKIAQGGLGFVYKARDLRMSRDVAIKRILTNPDDSSVTDEATRQLIKEASALASLQHPNIVTVYDVGKDADGPFVVMELLTGQTLEETVSEGSMTWEDFRPLAMQSLEALIAAQELHIVHRDIKPGNIMINWLPSGKFQVKVVDFGLAKLSSKPSLQTIDQSDGVFGSIYFMGPEQFERIPIDQRLDIYAIGCVFYYALTGNYPFDGDTAVEVMASHLQHHVTPIQEVRAGIPLWACNWIMWLINRQPGDRPTSAREALEIFVDNDSAYYAPELSTGEPTPTAPTIESRRAKLFIPGAAPEVAEEPKPAVNTKTASAPKPLRPPGTKSVPPLPDLQPVTTPEPPPAPTVQYQEPIPVQVEIPAPVIPQRPVPITPQLVVPNPPAPPTPAYNPTPPAPPIIVAPQQAQPPAPPALIRAAPAQAKVTPTVGLTSPALVRPTSNLSQPVQAITAGANPVSPTGQVENIPYQNAQNKKISTGLMVGLSIGLGIIVVFLIFFFLNKKRENAEMLMFNEMIQAATKDGATEVPVNKKKLEILLTNATTLTDLKDRYNIYLTLYLAKSTDGTDIDATIAKHATTQSMHPDIRVVLIRDVLGKRRNPSIIQTLLDFSKSTNEPTSAVAAIEACRFMANETHLQKFLDVLIATPNEQIRKATEDNIITILKKHKPNEAFRSALITTHNNSPSDSIKHATLRLIGLVGGDQSIEIIKKNLNNPDIKTKIAALGALGNSTDDTGYTMLIDYISGETNLSHRGLAFDAAVKYCTENKQNPQAAWTKLAELAKIQEDEMRLINGIANLDPHPWAFTILENIAKTSANDPSVNRAERAIDYLEKKKAIQGEGKKED
jgi:serine/threonine protein kinase